MCVSDLYEAHGEINHLLARLRATSGDVLLLHLVADNELNFSYKGPVTLRDLETGQTIQLDADQQRATYQQQAAPVAARHRPRRPPAGPGLPPAQHRRTAGQRLARVFETTPGDELSS
ncbi:MAG: hypothetical protein WKG07_26160 [Hymenobacter sp.]